MKASCIIAFVVGFTVLSSFSARAGGLFYDHVLYRAQGSPVGGAAADLDGDGDLDLATANFWEDSISILQNNGSGTFTLFDQFTAGDGPSAIVAADLDNDGDLD